MNITDGLSQINFDFQNKTKCPTHTKSKKKKDLKNN